MRERYPKIVLTLLMLLSFGLSAGEIKGVVRDPKTSEVVAAAVVMATSNAVPPHEANAFSEKDGSFTLKDLPAGTYEITVDWSGATSKKTVTVGEGQTVEVVMLVVLAEAKAESYTVVGSRIKRDNYSSGAPIAVINRDEETAAGLVTVKEVLQSQQVTGGVDQGQNTVGLRGLGAKRTLILLNGRRLSPSGAGGFTGSFDINALPSSMVERIEILKDGASSVYGSDAVAGVINVITKNDFNGFSLDGSFKSSEYGGPKSRIALVAGHATDKLSLSGAFEYNHQAELKRGALPWYQCPVDGYKDKTGRGQNQGYIDPRTGLPKCFTLDSAGITINTMSTTSGLRGVPAVGGILGANPDQTYDRWRPSAQIRGSGDGSGSSMANLVRGFEGVDRQGQQTDVRDTFDPRMMNRTLIMPVTNYNLYLQGHYQTNILGNAKPYFEFLWNRRDQSSMYHSQATYNYPRGSLLIPDQFADNIGVTTFTSGGNLSFGETVDNYRGTLGVSGDIGSKWHYDLASNYSLSKASYWDEGRLTDRRTFSTFVTADPVALAQVDPSLIFDGHTCSANVPGDPNYERLGGSCIPAPYVTRKTIFGDFESVPGNTSGPAWQKYLHETVWGYTTFWDSSTVLSFDGPLFTLPYGDVGTAVGAEFRISGIDDQPSIEAQNNNHSGADTAKPTVGTDNVIEGFAEVEVPILKDLPGAYELTLNNSARYTHYASYGSGVTYKVGGFYSPVSWVTGRANFGTSFRAPALFEQFVGEAQGFFPIEADPCSYFQGFANKTSNIYLNCKSELGAILADNEFSQYLYPVTDIPGESFGYHATSGNRVVFAGGAGSGLEAETSKNLTVGLIVKPPLGEEFGDLAIAADYYSIEIGNSVSRAGYLAILSNCYGSTPQNFAAKVGTCALLRPRGTPGTPWADERLPLNVLDAFTNIALDRVSGIDYTLRYSRKLGPGQVLLNALLTQYLDQSSRANPTDPTVNKNGFLGRPVVTGEHRLSYSISGWKINYGMRWVGAMDNYGNPDLFDEPVAPENTKYVFDVPFYAVHDASLLYAGNGWQVNVGVRNMLNTSPPEVSTHEDLPPSRIGNALNYDGYDVGRSWFINAGGSF